MTWCSQHVIFLACVCVIGHRKGISRALAKQEREQGPKRQLDSGGGSLEPSPLVWYCKAPFPGVGVWDVVQYTAPKHKLCIQNEGLTFLLGNQAL